MIAVFFLLCSLGARAMSLVPPYNHIGTSNANVDNVETFRTKSFLDPAAICTLDELVAIVGIRELEELIENVAVRKGVTPFKILSRLLERMKKRQDMEEEFLNTMEGAALHQLLQPMRPLKQPPLPSGVPYAYPPFMTHLGSNDDESTIYVIPVPKPQQTLSNSILPMPTPEHRLKNGVLENVANRPYSVKNTDFFPSVYPMIGPNSRNLKPPVGVTVRVSSSRLHHTLPDITVPVSPLMTIVEALRQAEIRYQVALAMSVDNKIIRFSRKPGVDCFVINEIDNVSRDELSAWKLEVADKEGQMIYEGICVPDDKRVQLKPGTTITLSFVHL